MPKLIDIIELVARPGDKQEQRKRRQVEHEAINRSLSSPPNVHRKKGHGGEGVPPNHTSALTVHHRRPTTPDLLNHSEFMKDALTDFELCLGDQGQGGGQVVGPGGGKQLSSFDLIHGSKEARAKFNTLPATPATSHQEPALTAHGSTSAGTKWDLCRQVRNRTDIAPEIRNYTIQ